jgi:NADH-quinone oxidoreductase subunit D
MYARKKQDTERQVPLKVVRNRAVQKTEAPPGQEHIFQTDEMIINMGPQHPSTHGVMRFVLTLDGETVKHTETVVGHLHRAQEWQGQNRTWFQYQALIDRVDYLSGMFTSWAMARAAEQVDQIEVPERAEYLRVIVSEMNRITSHLLWLATFAMDLGAFFGFPFYPFREREKLLDLLEEISGQRMMFNYIRIGGVLREPKASWFQNLQKFTREFDSIVNDYEAILTDNPVFLGRTKGTGVLPRTLAIEYSVTGPNLRASGVNYDLRKCKPYSVYPKLQFLTPSTQKDASDNWDRYICRTRELRQSNELIKQAMDMLPPSGPLMIKKQNAGLRIKAGEGFAAVESPRGVLGCYIVSNGSEKAYRFKWRNPSFSNLSVLPEIVRDSLISDFIATFGSLDVIAPDVDR